MLSGAWRDLHTTRSTDLEPLKGILSRRYVGFCQTFVKSASPIDSTNHFNHHAEDDDDEEEEEDDDDDDDEAKSIHSCRRQIKI